MRCKFHFFRSHTTSCYVTVSVVVVGVSGCDSLLALVVSYEVITGVLGYVSDSITLFIVKIIVFRLPPKNPTFPQVPRLVRVIRISYYICICDGNKCQNHSKWIKIYTKSVLFIAKCILVKMETFTIHYLPLSRSFLLHFLKV